MYYFYSSTTWGKLISIDGTLKDSVGVKNPYRYRGYRYDTETGLYYLQSRYYNSEWGRFINADGMFGTQGELLSHNIFTYCGNNPVNRDDPDGQFWGALLAGVGAVFTIPAEVAAVITVAVVAVAVLTVVAIVDVGVQEYRNHHVTYADNSTPKGDKEITDTGAPNSKTWKQAKKKIKEGKGKGINVKARNEAEAEQLINESRPTLVKRPTYEPNPLRLGKDIIYKSFK